MAVEDSIRQVEALDELWDIVTRWKRAHHEHPEKGFEIDHAPEFDILEKCIEIAQPAAEMEDDGRWIIAEAAAAAGKRYGTDIIGDFAHAVNKGKKKVSDDRQVFEYFGRELIAKYRENPLILFTHIRCAMRVGNHYENRLEALKFLDECVAEGWHSGEAEVEADLRMGKPPAPPKIGESRAKVISASTSENRVLVELESPDLIAAFQKAAKEKKRITIKAFEVPPPPEATPKT